MPSATSRPAVSMTSLAARPERLEQPGHRLGGEGAARVREVAGVDLRAPVEQQAPHHVEDHEQHEPGGVQVRAEEPRAAALAGGRVAGSGSPRRSAPTPASQDGDRSSRKPSQGRVPISGRWKSRWNSAPYPSTIVSTRTRNPQKASTCADPGHRPGQQLALAENLGEFRAQRGRPRRACGRARPVARLGRAGRAWRAGGRRRERQRGHHQPERPVPKSPCAVSPPRLRLSISSIRAGRTVCRSPTTPKSAIWKIGAFGSLLIATMVRDPCMPARCWIAPEMPPAR